MGVARDPDRCPPGGVLLAFAVNMPPRPQGSKRALPVGKPCPVCKRSRTVLVEHADAKLRKWRKAVTEVAADVWAGRPPIDAPVILGARFWFPRPPSHLKKRGGLRKGAPVTKQDPPDLSKLVRALEDAITDAKVWRDDSRVAEYRRILKGYTPSAIAVGVEVVILSWDGGSGG